MKKLITLLVGSMAVCTFVLGLYLVVHNINVPGSEKAGITESVQVVKIYEGGVKDIVFETAEGNIFYINRGLEQGYTLVGLENKLLNKTVTLRLTKKLAGVSSHIHELRIDGEVIFSELN
jgi:hypothetical protein